MNATLSILRRELGAYFNTPIGYVIIVFFLLITCFIYVTQLFQAGSADMRGYFGLLPFFLMLFVPAISMRLWAEERKLGTLELLMTMPVKSWQAVLGKFLAGFTFVFIMLALTFLIPLTLYILGNPDTGTIIGGYLGGLVLGMVYLAIGSFASSLTSDQIVAFIIGISINFLFFLMGYQPVLDWIKDFSPLVSSVVQRFGVDYHFESIARGVVDSRDIVYALTITGLFLFLNVLVIDRRR
ncbi:MAG TPA: ABC transporter permease [Planctomycetota bacterium]|nr:ABC transporter permease [Planctomycetota bacterium]